jgi:hypothetical protein
LALFLVRTDPISTFGGDILVPEELLHWRPERCPTVFAQVQAITAVANLV